MSKASRCGGVAMAAVPSGPRPEGVKHGPKQETTPRIEPRIMRCHRRGELGWRAAASSRSRRQVRPRALQARPLQATLAGF